MASGYSPEIFEDSANSRGMSARVEVFREEQSLNLKISDITVERLARVFKVIYSYPMARMGSGSMFTVCT